MTNVLSRPVALELSPGDAADIRMAEALPARCRAVKRLIADRGYDPDALRRTLRDLGTIPIVLAGRTGRPRSAMTGAAAGTAAGTAGASRRPSAASRTSGASPPSTTSSRRTSSPPSASSPSPPSGADRVRILEPRAGRFGASGAALATMA